MAPGGAIFEFDSNSDIYVVMARALGLYSFKYTVTGLDPHVLFPPIHISKMMVDFKKSYQTFLVTSS